MGHGAKGLPRYVTSFRDRHGRERITFRRKGWPTVYATERPGTAEFTQAYHGWLNAGPQSIGKEKAIPQSFDDLIARYYQTPEFEALKPTTQNTYRSVIEQFRQTYGKLPVASMRPRHITDLLAKMRQTPTQANNLRKRMNQLFKLAQHLEWRKDNPVDPTKGLKVRSGGYQTWQEQQIAAFQSYWPIGTMPRLAFDLALFTGQRRSDICDMGPSSISGDLVRVVQEKTGRPMMIPMHPDLRISIDATLHGAERFVVTTYAKPFTYNGFGNWFREKARAAGVDGYEFHGIRKAAARRLAEAGCTNAEIKAITGHVTDSEVARYTREAEQQTLARRAIGRLQLSNLSGLDSDDPNK
jgi:integrase